MPINGWYAGDADNVTDDGNVNGWADQSQQAFGSQIAGGRSYRFGPTIANFGTWGQLIFAGPNDLAAADWANPSGLDNHMPGDPGPGNSNWVQGHLVNGECGGHGDEAFYLTPITHNVNMWHSGYESVLQRLVNRGVADGAARQFNPHGLVDTRLIYRTQGLAPPTPGFPTVPNGICVSIGFVVNGLMQDLNAVQTEFANGVGNARWFNNWYYGGDGANHRARILQMVGGTLVHY